MRTTRTVVAALTAMALLIPLGGTAPAAAEDVPEDYVPTFVREDLWLHANDSPIGNVDARDGNFVRWDATEPTGETPAVYHGNNLNVFTGSNHDPAHYLTVQGTATGDLDTLAFEVYLHGWAQATIGCGMSLSFEVIIDGEVILSQDYTGSDGVLYYPVDETTGYARFALTNLWNATKLFRLPYGPDVEHDVYVNMQNFYVCNEYTWLYDSAATPSGLIVNLDRPARAGYFEVNVLNPPPPVES